MQNVAWNHESAVRRRGARPRAPFPRPIDRSTLGFERGRPWTAAPAIAPHSTSKVVFGGALAWLLVSAPVTHAHELAATAEAVPPTTWTSWSFDPGVTIPLILAAVLYARGLHRLRAATGVRDKLRSAALWFWCGWLVLVVALVSPLHPWGSELFAAHMTQHELLMVVAAPLLVLGRPGLVWLWAFSAPTARELVLWNRSCGGDWLWHRLQHPFVAWSIHLLALWIWHVPALFDSTLTSDFSHALQHLSFFGSAYIFWHAVLRDPRRRMGYGLALLYLFGTAMQSGALGALITFAHSAWYPPYAATAPRWGFTALEDQQLGGLIMWIPAALSYLVAALILFARWLQTSGATADTAMAIKPERAIT